MERREIKKLLLDLELPVAVIARTVGLSRAGVWKYFENELRSPDRRDSIQRFLDRRGREMGVRVPRFWPRSRSKGA